jgi:hypothetical protein
VTVPYPVGLRPARGSCLELPPLIPCRKDDGHSGAFSPDGQATHRCPAPGGQSLLRYPLKIDNGLQFIAVPVDSVASDGRR